MAVMKVVQAPNEVLNNLAKEVTFKESGLAKLLLDMEETLVKHTNPPGVGLAAPQVGVGLRIFLAKLGSWEMDKKGRHSPVSKHTSSSAVAEGLLSRGEFSPFQEGMGGFVYPENGKLYLGDIVICYPQARREASQKNKLVDQVIMELAQHGTLHLLGIHHKE